MPEIPDFSKPRYLDEVGWFLYQVKNAYNNDVAAYDALLDEAALKQYQKFIGDTQGVTRGGANRI